MGVLFKPVSSSCIVLDASLNDAGAASANGVVLPTVRVGREQGLGTCVVAGCGLLGDQPGEPLLDVGPGDGQHGVQRG